MAIKQYHPAHQDPQYPKKGKSMYGTSQPTPTTDGGNQQATEAKK